MKGDVCFSREPTRAVFKAVGSLLCRRLEIEWSNQSRHTGRIENTLLTMLPSISGAGVDPTRTWTRWRTYSDRGSAFASGQLAVAIEVIDQSVRHKLLKKGLANSCKEFFNLLSDFGRGAFSHDSEMLDQGLDVAYETIFDLAEIEPLMFREEFIDLWTGDTLAPTTFPSRSKIAKSDFRSLAIDAAFASLSAMKKMEAVIREANSVLDGKAIGNDVEPAIVRELLLAKFNEDAADLVAILYESLKLTFKPGGNVGVIRTSAVKALQARMNKEVKTLRVK